MDKNVKWGILGAGVGVGTMYVLNWTNLIMGKITAAIAPDVTVNLQSAVQGVDIKVVGLRALVDPGASDLIKKMLGYLPLSSITIPDMAILAAAGFGMFYLASMLLGKYLTGSKWQNLTAMLAVTALATAGILSMSIPGVAAIITTVVLAAILAGIIWGIDEIVKKVAGTSLIP